MKVARYCYQIPLLLGQGYRKDSKDPNKVEIFCYPIKIQGLEDSFNLISPTYLGELCQFSIKLPQRNSEAVKIKRCKISFESPELNFITCEELTLIWKINNYLWKFILPNIKPEKY